MDTVFGHLDLLERDYFGLSFVDENIIVSDLIVKLIVVEQNLSI